MNFTVRRYFQQIRQRWLIVVVVTAIAVLAAVLGSLTAHQQYLAKATLAVSSPDRAPEQDAKVVAGYASVFNDPATIGRLKATKNVPQEVAFQAVTVADSPILTIEATGENPNVTQESATKMAEAFRDSVNSARDAAVATSIADLERQLSDLLLRYPPVAGEQPSDPETRLREQINKLKFDETNKLHDLQLAAGVTPIRSSIPRNVALGAAGGLMLGILAALGMAAISTRIENSDELLEKTGIEPLVEVPSDGTRKLSRLREDRLRMLANVLSSRISSQPTVVALIDSSGVEGALGIAESLARVLAQQEYQTILVHAEGAAQYDGIARYDDLLCENRPVSAFKNSGIETLKILPQGAFFANRYSRMTRARITAVLDALRGDSDAVILSAPSISETPDAQLLCAAADLTIVVADARSSRANELTSLVNVLKKAGADIFGAILINGSKRESSSSTFVPGRPTNHPSELPAQATESPAPRRSNSPPQPSRIASTVSDLG